MNEPTFCQKSQLVKLAKKLRKSQLLRTNLDQNWSNISTFWDKGGTIDPHITYPPLTDRPNIDTNKTADDLIVNLISKGLSHTALGQLGKHSDEHVLQRISSSVVDACSQTENNPRTDVPELIRPWFSTDHHQIIERLRNEDQDKTKTQSFNQYSENKTKIWGQNILNQFNRVSSSCLRSHFVISLIIQLFITVSAKGIVYCTDDYHLQVFYYRQLARRIYVVSKGEFKSDDSKKSQIPRDNTFSVSKMEVNCWTCHR